MINHIHSLLYKPKNGWDPVPLSHATKYGNSEWARFNGASVDALEARIGPLHGKTVLDLGGGPGQYAVEFARRGALVTWHDVSRNYLNMAKSKAESFGIPITFSLGYLEDASRLPAFDFVFCRICWNYCKDDSAFAAAIYSLIRPGGSAYIKVPHLSRTSAVSRMTYAVNKWTGIKIGHPCPPPGRVQRLFEAQNQSVVEVEYLDATPHEPTEAVFVSRCSSARPSL